MTAMNRLETIASTSAPAARANAARGGRIGVLIVNLGTPDATDAPSVRRYLREFLSDARVIENQGLIWKFVLNAIILPRRPKVKGRDYEKIWNRERNESPLKTITRAQAGKLRATTETIDPAIMVDWAMRYGNPSLDSRIEALAKAGCERILLLPLYPQYAAATSATVCDIAFLTLIKLRDQPALRVVPPYYDDPVYIEALAASIEAELRRLPFKPELILASFHGIPKSYVEDGDPYPSHCAETVRLLRERMQLDETKLMLTFQSRFGKAEWLQPYTDKTVEALAKRGVKNLAVVTPGFSADCLETLEEIAVENAHVFKANGGENFAAIPCLNDSEEGMAVIGHLVLRELQGWI
ncbi:MAG: protoporphyrin/coproporphyrin ferrochelatase [Alphaproteobacteria bacterium]|jgi:ferrochelatase|nr:protoporphyrin/coproporphyrin ferrochelatase [Alphaproteobacteria bacterium]